MFNYYNLILKPNFLYKLNLIDRNFFLLYDFNKLIISLYIKNLKNYNDVEIFKAFAFLQSFVKKQVKIIYFSHFEKKKKILSAKIFIDLNSFYFYDFLNFFSNSFFVLLKKKQIHFLPKISNAFKFVFFFKDISVFEFLPAYYYD